MEEAPEAKSPTGKKTRTLYIRRAPNEEKKNKKKLVVARKPRPGEEITQVSEVGGSFGAKGIRRDKDGKPLERSILGSVDNFIEIEALETPDEFESLAVASEPTSPEVDPLKGGGLGGGGAAAGRLGSSLATSSHHQSSHPTHSSQSHKTDPSIVFHAYLHRLQASIKTSLETLKEEQAEEEAMMKSLLPSEKFSQSRDSKVMARWEERQKEWERLQSNIARRMGRDPKKMLMGDSNDFRERLEEYQTVLASVPMNERNIGSLWEMSLRDGGTRHAAIGNIFSGLFCPLKVDIPLPKVIRKPNLSGALPPLPPSSDNASMNVGMIEEESQAWRKDPSLMQKKKRLKKRLAEMRPHEITSNMVNNLVVVGYDLLQWAHDSSKQVYEAEHKKKLASAGGGKSSCDTSSDPFAQTKAVSDEINGSQGSNKELLDQASDSSNDEAKQVVSGPRIHLGPSPYVLLEAAVKEPTESSLKLENLGSTTLFFEWTRLEEETPNLVTVSKRKTANGTYAADPSALFAISKDAVESRFLCQNASGVLMPGQTKATVFAFESSTAGSFSETWKLKLTPPAEVSGELIPSEDGLITVSLLGACLAADTNEHRRLPVRLGLERKVTCADMKELVTSVVREVRTPRREETVRAAQKLSFESKNVNLGLNFTPAIYDRLAALWYKVNDLAPPEIVENGEDDEPLCEWDGDVNSIKSIIDRMYDENSTTPRPGQMLPQSSMDEVNVEKLGKRNSEDDENDSENEEDEDEKAESSMYARGNRGSNSQGRGSSGGGGVMFNDNVYSSAFSMRDLGDNDDFDEDENDVESVAVDESEFSDLKRARLQLDLEWKLLVARSAVRPFPSMAHLAKEKLNQLADLVVDAVENTRSKQKISKSLIYEPLPSPFTPFYTPVDSEYIDRDKVWQEALVPDEAESNKNSPEFLYRSKVHSTLSASFSKLIESFSEVADKVHHEALESYTSNSSRDLEKVACARYFEDVEDKRVLLLLDLDIGEYMIPDTYGGDEFVLPPAPKPQPVFAAVRVLRKVLKYEPNTVIITSELTPTPATDKHPSPDLGTLSLKSLEPMLAAMLRTTVTFCPSIEAMEEFLKSSEKDKQYANKPRVILLDHVDADTMIPVPEQEELPIPDEEEEVLPWLGDEKQDPSLLPPPAAKPLDLGEALKPFVDMFVYDTTSDSCLDEERCLSKLGPFTPSSTLEGSLSPHSKLPISGAGSPTSPSKHRMFEDLNPILRVAGPNLHREIITVHMLQSRPKRPMLAIVGGHDLLAELKHIDRMIDIVDELVIAGPISLVFLAALGHKTGAVKHDAAYMPMARALLSKAQMMGVPVTLPVDFVMGDLPLVFSDDGIRVLSPKSKGGSVGGYDLAEEEDNEDEPPLESNGFDYDGETLECTVSEGLMRRMHALDLGHQSIDLFKELLERCETILWTGMVGAAQCAAFQHGSRELVDAVIQAHEDRGAIVALGGKELVKWANMFYHSEDFAALGDGNGVTHCFRNINLAKRLLAMVPIPGVYKMSEREPNDEELMLFEEIKAKKLMDGVVDSDEEDEDDDDIDSIPGEEGDY